ncbi:hypothetical protein STSO111631_00550 [Stackebrandtia soli]
MSLEGEANEVLADGFYDWVPLDYVMIGAKCYAEESGIPKEDAFRELIAYLLGEGLMVVGELGNGFEVWDISIDEAIGHSMRVLVATDWFPAGEGPWFKNTEKGDRRGEAHEEWERSQDAGTALSARQRASVKVRWSCGSGCIRCVRWGWLTP